MYEVANSEIDGVSYSISVSDQSLLYDKGLVQKAFCLCPIIHNSTCHTQELVSIRARCTIKSGTTTIVGSSEFFKLTFEQYYQGLKRMHNMLPDDNCPDDGDAQRNRFFTEMFKNMINIDSYIASSETLVKVEFLIKN